MDKIECHTPESLAIFVNSKRKWLVSFLKKKFQSLSTSEIEDIISDFILKIIEYRISNFIIGKEVTPVIRSLINKVIDKYRSLEFRKKVSINDFEFAI